MNVRTLTLALLPVAAAMAAPVQAAEFRDYEPAAFAAAQEQGKPILLGVHAWWCPVCASQSRTIKATVGDKAYDNLIVFRINYDKQKSVWQGFGVKKQATLIAFKGRQEIGRIAFKTDKDEIRALLASTVS